MRPYRFFFALYVIAMLSACGGSIQEASIQVTTGPTAIPRGDAQGKSDITVNNGVFAIAFAADAETVSPWGVARGGIVDVGLIEDGVIGQDFFSLADFMPNNWSSWPTTYQRVSVAEQTSDKVVIRTERDWGDVSLETTFTIRANDSRITIDNVMKNDGDTDLDNLLSGFVAWPHGGYLFGVPGLSSFSVDEIDEASALADWSVGYDRNWVFGLHAPYSETIRYFGRDRYKRHDLAVGGTQSFSAVLQFERGGDLAPVVSEEIRYQELPSGTVYGSVSSNGGPVAAPAVVASIDGKPFAWTIGENGNYEFELPAGRYEIYATAEKHSASPPVSVEIGKDARLELDFDGVEPPGTLRINVEAAGTGQPLDARISIDKGPKSLIAYYGRNTFFTQLDRTGQASMKVAPGDYEFAVSAGGGFTSETTNVDVTVEPGGTKQLVARIPVVARPSEFGWYSADLHHHSDVLDGFSDPEDVMRSELASDIDLTFLSDHDSMVNNAEMQRLSDAAGLPFIPAAELSPSWAHFNAYPIDAGKTIDIDVGQASVQEVFAEARRLGAKIIHANHPYGDYGYFASLEIEAVPGGYDGSFDAIEITAADNSKTMTHVWNLWNAGKRAYLVGGSDAHDVFLDVSGTSRTYAFIRGDVTVDAFIAAVKAGHAYATQGPIVYPGLMFGNEFEHDVGDTLTIAFAAIAASGLGSAQLVSNGEVVDTTDYDGEKTMVQRKFEVDPAADTWYSLLIEDQNGKFAYTNPIWVTVKE